MHILTKVIRSKLFTRWFTTLSALTLIGQLALWLPCKSGKFHPILTRGRASSVQLIKTKFMHSRNEFAHFIGSTFVKS